MSGGADAVSDPTAARAGIPLEDDAAQLSTASDLCQAAFRVNATEYSQMPKCSVWAEGAVSRAYRFSSLRPLAAFCSHRIGQAPWRKEETFVTASYYIKPLTRDENTVKLYSWIYGSPSLAFLRDSHTRNRRAATTAPARIKPPPLIQCSKRFQLWPK
jgi:hypothetical protein